MPYKDAKRKTEWERLHRPQRLARRRELRKIEAAWNEAHPGVPRTAGTAANPKFHEVPESILLIRSGIA